MPGGAGGTRGRFSDAARWSDANDPWRLRLPAVLEALGELKWRRPDTLSSAVVSPVSSNGLGVASSRLTLVADSTSVSSATSRVGTTEGVRLCRGLSRASSPRCALWGVPDELLPVGTSSSVLAFVGDVWSADAGRLSVCKMGLRGSNAGLAKSLIPGPGVEGVG